MIGWIVVCVDDVGEYVGSDVVFCCVCLCVEGVDWVEGVELIFVGWVVVEVGNVLVGWDFGVVEVFL